MVYFLLNIIWFIDVGVECGSYSFIANFMTCNPIHYVWYNNEKANYISAYDLHKSGLTKKNRAKIYAHVYELHLNAYFDTYNRRNNVLCFIYINVQTFLLFDPVIEKSVKRKRKVLRLKSR